MKKTNENYTPTLKENEILRLDHLSMHFGGLKAVDDLSFEIKEGEIFGLIGPNGAGKTTVFNCITQFYTPTLGHVPFRLADGSVVDLTSYKVHDIIGLGLVRTFQNVEMVKELSIIDNVMVGAHPHFRTGVLGHMFRTPKARKEEREYRKKAEEILERIGIAEFRDFPAKSAPYGVQKKAEMARGLMANPRLIILDEPAAGLNDKETEELAKIIHELRDEFKCTVLLVEHDMGLVMSICDRICAISFGQFLACGKSAEIQSNPLVQEAYLGVKKEET